MFAFSYSLSYGRIRHPYSNKAKIVNTLFLVNIKFSLKERGMNSKTYLFKSLA